MQVIIKYAKHPPKMANQEFHKTTFQDFRPSFAFFRRKYKPQHNGKDDMVSTQAHHTIKVRSREMWKADAEE
jgi:hypothetical protein